jgi:farnesol dehydrogenase
VKRVLVTGGTGYLGGAVVRAFAEAGWQVRCLLRPTSDRSVLPPGVEVVTGDVTDPATLRPALAHVQAVCHSAALVSSWVRDRSLFQRVNVEGLVNVLDAALASAVGRVVYTSTFFASGPSDEAPSRQGGAVDEAYVPVRRRFHTEYERTKTEALHRVEEFAARGLPVVTVMPGVLYGPGRETEGSFINPLIAAIARGRLGPLVGTGRQRWCFTYLADVARGHVLAADRGQPGARYILGGENLPLAGFLSLVAELARARWRWRALPLRLAQALTLPALLRARLGGPPPRLTPGAVAALVHSWAFSSEKARRELGYSITPVRTALQETLAWLQDSGR